MGGGDGPYPAPSASNSPLSCTLVFKERSPDLWQRYLLLFLFSPLTVPSENTTHPPTTGELPNCLSVSSFAPKCLSLPKPGKSA